MRLHNYPDDGPLIYKSWAFEKVVTQAIDAGGDSRPLLLLGEGGVGKGMRKVDVRFIFTASAESIVGELRELIGRNIIQVPPLADRPEDVRGLYEYWNGQLAGEHSALRTKPTEQAMAFLERQL